MKHFLRRNDWESTLARDEKTRRSDEAGVTSNNSGGVQVSLTILWDTLRCLASSTCDNPCSSHPITSHLNELSP
ncbi:hypothetical protein TNCV_1281831 [Trichonephila clavipes]|uniref:Uncharacterized protein n=1 Tax=Trichonephila clavipes TaxID=2585209 RepID=A0A8X6SPX5_TRICX|nr:hypothetical protein TNCV_1281831 [Trichonephila clavipes]